MARGDHGGNVRRIGGTPIGWLGAVLLVGASLGPAGARPGAMQATQSWTEADRRDWIQLFNGRDLNDWSIKFRFHALGENLHQTFRAEDGLLKVRYDGWSVFAGEFGHIFYREPFSYYVLAAEYRFVGAQVRSTQGGLEWAVRNNGLMLHAQEPKTMLRDQDFPISIEVQLLGGLGDGRPRPTANLCTPGTHVVLNGRLHTPHCTDSRSRTFDGDQWVRVAVVVHGGEVIRHLVEGEPVLEYSNPQIGGGEAAPVDPAVKVDGTPLTGGYIALQAETAPIDFRRVELLNLEGCTDPKAATYRPYVVRSNAAACGY